MRTRQSSDATCNGLLVGRWSAAAPGAKFGVANPTTAGATAPKVDVEQRWSVSTLEEYQRGLRLTPAQVSKIRPLLQETSQKLSQMRRDLKTNIHTAVRSMNVCVSTELTLAQRREFVALIREKVAENEEKSGK